MLPFLKKMQEGSVSIPSETVKREPDEGNEEDMDSLHMVAEEMLLAIKANDSKALAEALRAVFEIVDSEPHQEAGE